MLPPPGGSRPSRTPSRPDRTRAPPLHHRHRAKDAAGNASARACIPLPSTPSSRAPPPPDSLGVLRVLPEVENVLMVEVAVGNAVGRIHHPEDRVIVLLIARISLENRGGPGVLPLPPFQGLCAVNVLEPQIRIGGRDVFLMLPVHAVRSHRTVRRHRRPAEGDRPNDRHDHFPTPTHGCSQDSVGTSLGTGNERR